MYGPIQSGLGHDPLAERMARRTKRERKRMELREGIWHGVNGGSYGNDYGILGVIAACALYVVALIMYYTVYILFDEAKKKFGKKKQKSKRPKIRVIYHEL